MSEFANSTVFASRCGGVAAGLAKIARSTRHSDLGTLWRTRAAIYQIGAQRGPRAFGVAHRLALIHGERFLGAVHCLVDGHPTQADAEVHALASALSQ